MKEAIQHKLIEAIDRAQKPGICRYLNDNGTPCCIVGQVLFEEVGPDVLADWDIGAQPFYDVEYEVKEFDSALLCALQEMWDGSNEQIQHYTKANMRTLVNYWPSQE